MKSKIINFIKKNPYLYNLAKKTYRLFNKEVDAKVYDDKTIYIGYILNNIDELEKINIHFNKLNINKSEILLFVNNDSININKLMPEYSVVSINYFKKYHKKYKPKNVFMYDFKEKNTNDIFISIM